MALAKQFSRNLDNLWKLRTAKVRSLLIPRGVGKPKVFTKKVREQQVDLLLTNATKILLRREGFSELKNVAPYRHLRQIKGRGLLKRGQNLLTWAEGKLYGPFVYVFWKGKKCLYVGKAGSWKRFNYYGKSAYLQGKASVETFTVTSKSQLAKAECLATHLFKPRDKKVKPAKVKWGKACPICRKHDYIQRELKALFKMK